MNAHFLSAKIETDIKQVFIQDLLVSRVNFESKLRTKSQKIIYASSKFETNRLRSFLN